MLRLGNKGLRHCLRGGFGLPKGGDGFISSPFGPAIPWRGALQQSPLLFHWTKTMCTLGGAEPFQKSAGLIPRCQTKRAISQMQRPFFGLIMVGAGFHAFFRSVVGGFKISRRMV